MTAEGPRMRLGAGATGAAATARARRAALACALAALLLGAAACTDDEAPVRSPLDDRGAQPTIVVPPGGFPPPFGTPLAPPSETPTAPAGGPPAAPTPAAPGGGAASGDRESAIASAIDALAERTGLAAGRFTLDRAQPTTWTDGCLEVAIPRQTCTQALVPGYRVVLRYQTGSLHEMRTGRPGQAVWAPQTVLNASLVSVGGTLTLEDASGRRHAVLVGPGTRLADVTLAALRPGDRVAAGVDDLRDGTPLRAAWLARE